MLYTDEQGKRKQKSLGHSDARKAERRRAQFEHELRMGVVEPGSMKLSDFVEENLTRTGDQIRESTQGSAEEKLRIEPLSLRDVYLDNSYRLCLYLW